MCLDSPPFLPAGRPNPLRYVQEIKVYGALGANMWNPVCVQGRALHTTPLPCKSKVQSLCVRRLCTWQRNCSSISSWKALLPEPRAAKPKNREVMCAAAGSTTQHLEHIPCAWQAGAGSHLPPLAAARSAHGSDSGSSISSWKALLPEPRPAKPRAAKWRSGGQQHANSWASSLFMTGGSRFWSAPLRSPHPGDVLLFEWRRGAQKRNDRNTKLRWFNEGQFRGNLNIFKNSAQI